MSPLFRGKFSPDCGSVPEFLDNRSVGKYTNMESDLL